ncbi:MAG: hypothetical protein ACPG5W_11280, partial [Flavobacteriales bacterium]
MIDLSPNISGQRGYNYGVSMVVESIVTIFFKNLLTIEKVKLLENASKSIDLNMIDGYSKIANFKDNPLGYAQHYRRQIVAIIHIEHTNIKGAKVFCKMIGGSWNEEYYRNVLNSIETENWDEIQQFETNVELLAVAGGTIEAIEVLSHFVQLLENGKDVPIMYYENGIHFIKANLESCWTSEKAIFHKLLDDYLDMEFRTVSERQWFEKNDKAELETVFKSVSPDHDWSYVIKRLGASLDQLEAIRASRNDFILQNYLSVYRSPDKSSHAKLATLKAIKGFITFLSAKDQSETIAPSALETDPYTGNLALVEFYHDNLDEAYEKLHGNFIGADLETFKGIFKVLKGLERSLKA